MYFAFFLIHFPKFFHFEYAKSNLIQFLQECKNARELLGAILIYF